VSGRVISRRTALKWALSAATLPALGRGARADLARETPLHGLSAFGDLKYPPGFPHFDYASPEAPVGGVFNFSPPNWLYNQSPLTFNTLNSFALRGEAPPRMELCFDGLMTAALEEPDALYGLLAEHVTVSADGNGFTFKLRPEARFHDGSAITAEDVAFTYRLLKEKGHPDFLLPLSDMAAAEADGDTFRLVLNGKQSPRLILTLAGFPILSKADIEANGFEGGGLRPLLGSGPYTVGRVSAGQTVEYDRMPDYWARDLNVRRGLNHFDRLRIEFFGDRQASFEAFKKGDILFRQEFVSRVWATEYDFPALDEGKVVKREFPSEKRPSMQAWALNQRRARFQDRRVREAIGLCFDFEWTKRNLFYDSYERSQSLFERSDYKAEGAPSPQELALLEPLRGAVPGEAFGPAVLQPVSNGSGRDRALLSRASKLLREAGWEREGSRLVKGGEALTLEFLIDDPTFERLGLPLIENLRAVGIDASLRLVDSAQYEKRQKSFDFDMIMMALSFGATPTRDSLEGMFHSRAAGRDGTGNLPGTGDPAVDALVDAVGRAQSREDLTTAMRTLDRVLRARLDWIPCWYAPTHRAAFWDVFGFKEPKPDYGFPVESLWWWDGAKAQAIGKG
jgi:microcin C transport system substrate-binding protein